jgi:hypothetical protein
MKVLLPKIMNFESLVSTDVADDAAAEWASGTTYAQGDTVKLSYAENGTDRVAPVKLFVSLADANTGNYPGTDAENWIEVSAVNRWKLFDIYAITQTEKAGSMTFRIDTSKCDTIAFINAEAADVSITMYDSEDAVVHNEEDEFPNSAVNITNWLDYFYEEFVYSHDVVYTLPVYLVSETEFTLTKTGLIGKMFELGTTQYEPKVGINDYSRVETNAYGYDYLSPGNYAKRLEFEVLVRNSDLGMVYSLLSALRAIPTLWEANNGTGHDTLTIYGYVKTWDLLLEGPIRSRLSIEIKGLV